MAFVVPTLLAGWLLIRGVLLVTAAAEPA